MTSPPPLANSWLEPLTPDRLERLRALAPTRTDDTARERAGRDETERLLYLPDALVLPRSTEEVSRVLAFAHEHRLAVTPRGAGTGLSGGALPVHGGIVLSVEELVDTPLVDTRNLTVEAASGIVLGDLQRAVAAEGLFYPPDPGSRDTCLLAGTLAENSAGPRSCKYGTTREWVLGLEAVLPDGRVIETGGAVRKDVAGYDLTRLLVGSEGTLTVITRATLRLIPQPRATLVLLFPFPSLESAAAAVETVFREGFDPAACELMEERALDAVARLTPLPDALQGRPAMLLLELHGDRDDELLERAEALSSAVRGVGGEEPHAALDPVDQERLWSVRRKIGTAVKHLSVYKEADTVVPRHRLVDLVQAAREAAGRHGLEVVCYGHAGDGNLHVNILRGALDESAWETKRDAVERELFEAVVDLGGSVTGEHGIGATQRRFLPLVRDPASIEMMRGIKKTFDPRGILNPGKIFLEEPTH